MEKMKVRDLMVPVDRFPKISVNASLYEALSRLEEVHEAVLSGKSQYRVLLVEDDAEHVIGKISPIDLFLGLERNYAKVNYEESLRSFGLSYVSDSMQEDYNLWQSPFKDLCRKASNVHVKDFINVPSESQLVDTENNLSKCLHLFVMSRHDALFVQENKKLVGMLLFSDVYARVSQVIKACSF